jgi:polyisoprenoid-binding protein YceI
MRGASWVLLSLTLLRAQAADMYRLDTVNTRISFNIRYFGTPWVSAGFADFGGEFVLDRHGAASRVDVSVRTASVDCHDWYWNARLRYPQMRFHSEQVEFEGGDRALASGELSLHGVTRRVDLEISQLSCPAAGSSGASCCFVAHARLKRSDFGLAHGLWIGGKQVDIVISGVGVRRDAPPPGSVERAVNPQPRSATASLTQLQ